MKGTDLTFLAVAAGALYALSKDDVQLAGTQTQGVVYPAVAPDVIATSGEVKEAQAQKVRSGDTSTVTQSDINNLRERQITQTYKIDQQRAIANRLEQQQADIAKRQYEQFRATGSHAGGSDVDLITTVRRDGKIYVYRNGEFIGFQTGEQAQAYAKSFNSGAPLPNVSSSQNVSAARNSFQQDLVKKQQQAQSMSSGGSSSSSSSVRSSSSSGYVASSVKSGTPTATDRRVASSSKYKGSSYTSR